MNAHTAENQPPILSHTRTRVKANSGPHATASAKTLEERLRVWDEQIEKMPAEADPPRRRWRRKIGRGFLVVLDFEWIAIFAALPRYAHR